MDRRRRLSWAVRDGQRAQTSSEPWALPGLYTTLGTPPSLYPPWYTSGYTVLAVLHRVAVPRRQHLPRALLSLPGLLGRSPAQVNRCLSDLSDSACGGSRAAGFWAGCLF